jgi:hypothetical protein
MRNVARGVTAIMRMRNAATVGACSFFCFCLFFFLTLLLSSVTSATVGDDGDDGDDGGAGSAGGGINDEIAADAGRPTPTAPCAAKANPALHAATAPRAVASAQTAPQWVPCALIVSAQRHSRVVASRALLTVANIATLLATRSAPPSAVALRRSMAFRMNVDHPQWRAVQSNQPPALVHSESTQHTASATFQRIRFVAEGAADWLHVSDLVRRDAASVDRALR